MMAMRGMRSDVVLATLARSTRTARLRPPPADEPSSGADRLALMATEWTRVAMRKAMAKLDPTQRHLSGEALSLEGPLSHHTTQSAILEAMSAAISHVSAIHMIVMSSTYTQNHPLSRRMG